MIRKGRLALEAIAAGLVTGLILVTCIDVVGRYMFNSPLSGAYEMVQCLLGALVFVALPLTTAKGGHVEVDLLLPLLPEQVNRVLGRLAGAISALVLLYFAYRLALLASDQFHTKLATSALGFQLWYLAAVGTASCAVSAAIALLRRTE